MSLFQSEQSLVKEQQTGEDTTSSPVSKLSVLSAAVILLGLSISTTAAILKYDKDKQTSSSGGDPSSIRFDYISAIGLLIIWTGRFLLTANTISAESNTT